MLFPPVLSADLPAFYEFSWSIQSSMRNFTDASGIDWTVFEVRRQGNEEDNWAYLPRGFRAGWLCFESDAGKRRLSPVPDGWRSFEGKDLERLLRRAAAVVRTRRDSSIDDLNIGSPGEADPESRV
jgi:hypothetical protein